MYVYFICSLWKVAMFSMHGRASPIIILFVCVWLVDCHFGENVYNPNHPSTGKFDSNIFTDSPPFQYSTPKDVERDIPMIVWWTGRLFVGNSIKLINCPNSECYSTADRLAINDPRTYGFYFYGTDLDPEDMPMPRKPHHEWALFHEESPMNNFMLVHHTMLKLFNHTSTFRRESDYPITSNAIPSLNYLLKRQPVSIQMKNEARKQGLAPVLFIQSHCDIASDRERYVKELMNYVDIDSVGNCLHNKDLPKHLRNPVETMEHSDLYRLISKYKFHIAFENAICKDYMTEKLFRPLHVGSVPVYKGSSHASDWMPNNHSIIMVDEFLSPEKLASFLKHLDNNDTEYERFLDFKTSGITNQALLDHFHHREWGINEADKPDPLVGFECYICDRLTERYDQERLHKLNPSIPLMPRRMANFTHMNCPQPHPSIGNIDDIPQGDTWLEQFWSEDYWSGLEKAMALTEMIENHENHPASFQKYWENRIKSRTDVLIP